jgi:hypothetical protein
MIIFFNKHGKIDQTHKGMMPNEKISFNRELCLNQL